MISHREAQDSQVGSDSADQAALVVRNLRLAYPGGDASAPAIADVSFDVPAGSMFTLLGPSGCGKTSTLRCIAGLEKPDAGLIVVGKSTISGPETFVPSYDRRMGMVFQSYAIWPHMSVAQNVAFPLSANRATRVPKAEREALVQEVLRVVELDGLEKRSAVALSGGQQQRLALARALVAQPKVLLLDEPLSNLDARLRDTMREEIRALQKRLGITTIYVTHDQAEALSMSDQIAVMSAGRVVQLGSPREIYGHPASKFVAEFIGKTNLLNCVVRDVEQGCLLLEGAVGQLRVDGGGSFSVQDPVTVAIRPEDILIRRSVDDASVNEVLGVVARVSFLGDLVEVVVQVNNVPLTIQAHPSTDCSAGDSVALTLPSGRLSLIPAGA